MALTNTLILPTDDASLAIQMLNTLIHDQPHVVMISLGTSDEIQRMVEMADKIVASQSLILAQAWIREPAHVADLIGGLPADPDSLRQQIRNARAITLSHSDVIRDVITATEPKPDMARLFQSFAIGSKI